MKTRNNRSWLTTLTREQTKALMERQAQEALGVSAEVAVQQARSGEGRTLMHSHLLMLQHALDLSR